jgi:hypothetical protein
MIFALIYLAVNVVHFMIPKDYAVLVLISLVLLVDMLITRLHKNSVSEVKQ